MGRLAARDMIEHAQRDQALAWHLQSNHYPPVHSSFIPAANTAIDACNKGKYKKKIKMPNGITKTASDIIEGLHLENFVTWPDD